jgi:flagellar biosynthesis protein FlhF
MTQVAEEIDYTVTLTTARASLLREPPTVRLWAPGASERAVTQASQSDAEATPAARVDLAGRAPPQPAQAHERHVVAGGAGGAAATRLAAPLLQREPGADALQTAQLMDEMRAIKRLLEHQLAGFAWGEVARENPTRALLLSEMLTAGFSAGLARRLVNDLPQDLGQEESRKWLTAAVNRRLRTLASDADFIDRGGVYALVGPTGVGKTTTIAKLAARCVVRHGAERLALVTTDSYRIGAHEQLRIYGRILGVPVFVVRDGAELQRTLADLHEKHMVLIDTAGMSQRDSMVAEQAAMLTRSPEVNRLLLLNAGSRGDTLDDVVQAYGGDDLAGCILTKVDEASALAPAVDCIARHGLVLSYVANGQRVPEDLHLPNRKYLLHRAFKVGAGETAHTLKKEEFVLGWMGQESAQADTPELMRGAALA